MKTKIKLLAIFIFISGAISAQNFFKPIPRIKTNTTVRGAAATATGEVTIWALRPVASAVTLYIDGDVQAAAGGGISFQNITQRASDGRSYVNYAANLVILAGGPVTDNANKSDIQKAALYISALNNTVGLGYGIARQEDPFTLKKKWKGGLAVVWTYNFNN